MRRGTAALLLALALLGCEARPAGDPVSLLTGWGPFEGGGSCYANFAEGILVADPQYGTGVTVDSGDGLFTVPVLWRPGFSARQLGPDVVVYDPEGTEVARTGRRYRMAGGYWSETITPTKENHYAFSGPRVFVACDVVHPV